MATQDATTGSGVSFATDQETRLILDSLDEFVEREVEPMEAELGETYENPRLRHEPDGRLVPEVLEAIREVRRKSAEAGFYAMNLPEDVGGEGVSAVTWYRAKRHVASKGTGLASHVLAGPEGPKPLLLQAEGEQVERYLEPAIRAEKSTAFAQTEPGVGSDSPNMATTAEKDGDDWVLNGTKQWITNAPYADFVQLFARTTPQEEAGRYGGITCFIVERDEYEIGSYNNAVGAVGSQAEIVLDGVRVPEDRVLGEVDGGFQAAMNWIGGGRINIAASAVGNAQYLLDLAVDYAKNRETFGKPISERQGISFQLAELATKIVQVRWLYRYAAWKIDNDQRARKEESMAKWQGALLNNMAADIAMQIHGGAGFMKDQPIERQYRSARVLRIFEGTDEIQKRTIARELF
jgi:acyl-CoA dehydrogenase